MNSAGLSFLVLLMLGCRAAPDRVAIPAEGALGPYSNLVLSGDLCFVSGKIGPGAETFEQEVHGSIDRVEEALASVGLGLEDVVAATVYLTDMGLYQALNGVYGQRFPAPYPARACVAVKELPGDARVEIMVTARRR